MISEKEFQAAVVQAFRLHGWKVFHPYDSRRSEPGFPDLTMLTPRGRVVFAELKSDKGRVTDAQEEWLDWVNAGTVEGYLWRPADWPQIEVVLAGQVPEE